MSLSFRFQTAALAVFTLTALLVTGCGVGPVSTASVSTDLTMSGRVHGGQQPVSGSAISLYLAGSTGPGRGAQSLLVLPVITDRNGNFTITGDYSCPSSSAQVYLVARGGNPGLPGNVSNAALVLTAALGDCGNLRATTFIDVDEVTTAAAAWSLAQFMGAGASVGASATNATGLRNAFLAAANLADSGSGTAPGAASPAGATLETAKVNTLADVLANCVNSSGGSACAPLFAAATMGGVAPTNVLDAALNIVRQPGTNVTAVFNLAAANAPFQPMLKSAPNDWTMSVTYTRGGIATPTGVGVDSSGGVWIANYYGGVVSNLTTAGAPVTPNGYADPALYETFSLAIDPLNNVWLTNQEGTPANQNNGSISKFSQTGQVLSGGGFYAGGVYYPYSIAADTDGVMWVADYGHSGATILNNDGTAYQGNPGYISNALPLPFAVSVDGSHNGWFAATGYATKLRKNGVASAFSCCQSAVAIEVDANSNVWVADYRASALVELNQAGTVLQQISNVGGLQYPEGLTIDGAGTVWVTAYRTNVIAAFGTASGGAGSTVLSPARGFGLDAKLVEPFSLVPDASGNLWVTNFGSDSVTEFVGIASPVKTPVVGPPVAP